MIGGKKLTLPTVQNHELMREVKMKIRKFKYILRSKTIIPTTLVER